MKIRQSLVALVSIAYLIPLAYSPGCAPTTNAHDTNYIQEITQWRSDRLERLQGPRSWLSLIGRFPIQVGATSVGMRDTSGIRFPGNVQQDIAILYLDSIGLTMRPASDNILLLEDEQEFQGGRINTIAPPVFHHDALYWTFLERAGKYYLRLWDTLSPARKEVGHIPAYPPDPEWIVDVTFFPADSGATITLDDVQGMKRVNIVEGSITGVWHDTAFTLLALDGGAEELFIIIEDATTDIETYPGGRYLDIPKADSTGHTTIDFNKAYIPPCAFTEFATCLLPPKENRLPFAVTAGEKTFGHE